MKPAKIALWSFVFVLPAAWGAAMPSSARNTIPSTVQQVISVDYRTLKNSDTAMALKAQVLPPSLKEFEDRLKSVGIDPEKDADQLAFASYRGAKSEIRVVGVAQGSFSSKVVLKKMRLGKIKPVKYRDTDVYPMSNGMEMTFLDDNTLLFGDGAALRGALDTRDGYNPSLDSNSQVADMIGPVESGTVWSVLDQQGTQNMLISALGDAGKLADFDMVRKRVQGSRYSMNFTNGVTFDLDVVTSDSMTAGTLSSLVKAGVLYRKMTATPVEKVALENVSVNSDSSNLQMHFKANDKQFQSLLHSDLFAAVSK
ncbi:MAG TPA: hypothetical protein VKR57_03265 [Terriglobales bacterium]|jgi:hypothetical protein|nr:hypothetical protein [Terriglobales bacterium]